MNDNNSKYTSGQQPRKALKPNAALAVTVLIEAPIDLRRFECQKAIGRCSRALTRQQPMESFEKGPSESQVGRKKDSAGLHGLILEDCFCSLSAKLAVAKSGH